MVGNGEESTAMRQFRNILLVSQGTGADTDALRQALSLAASNGATLHALITVPQFPKDLAKYSDAWEHFLLERLKQEVEACTSALQIAPAPEVRAIVASGSSPAVRIIRHVLRQACDLLIKQAEPVESRAGFSALDMQLLRQCPCPVWLCRPVARPAGEIRVAVAVDPVNDDLAGHELALDLLKASRSLADVYSGELAVVSCWNYELEEDLRHNPWLHIPENEISQTIASTEQKHRSALDAMMAEAHLGGRIQIHHLKGRPDRMIPTFVADEQIDILVMGTVARTGIPGFVMGNTAENVLRRLFSSLLVLKPRGFVSAVSAYE
jgi:nucleotide-binding universal stress UspA family protein